MPSTEGADRDELARAWEAGLRAGCDYERAKWYWAAGNRAAMAAAGMAVERPVRPQNPFEPPSGSED